MQDELEARGLALGQGERLGEAEVDDAERTLAEGCARGLEGELDVSGGREPDVPLHDVIGEKGERRVAAIEVGLEDVPSGSVGDLDVAMKERSEGWLGGRPWLVEPVTFALPGI